MNYCLVYKLPDCYRACSSIRLAYTDQKNPTSSCPESLVTYIYGVNLFDEHDRDMVVSVFSGCSTLRFSQNQKIKRLNTSGPRKHLRSPILKMPSPLLGLQEKYKPPCRLASLTTHICNSAATLKTKACSAEIRCIFFGSTLSGGCKVRKSLPSVLEACYVWVSPDRLFGLHIRH